MKVHEVETLLDQFENYFNALIAASDSQDAGNILVLKSHRESFLETICKLFGVRMAVEPPEGYDCPDCGSKMKERRNRQNGDVFYGCIKYPDCKGTRDQDGLSRDERAAKKEITQQDGFSFRRT